MSIKLSIILYLYYAFLFIWGLFSLAALYHMFKYGFRSFVTIFSVILYIVISIIIINISFLFITQVDWSAELFNFAITGSTDLLWK